MVVVEADGFVGAAVAYELGQRGVEADVVPATAGDGAVTVTRGPDRSVVRPSWMYGPGDRGLFRFASMARRLPVLIVSGDGGQAVRPVFVGDVAAVVADVASGARLPSGTIEVAGPDELTLDDALRVLLAVMGRRRRLVHLGARLRLPPPPDDGALVAPTRLRAGLARFLSPFVVREAGPADEPAVVAIRLAAYGAIRDRYPSERSWVGHAAELASVPSETSTVLIAEELGRAVGTVALLGDHVRFLAVDPAVQGRGVARLLMDEAVRRGARRLSTATWMAEARRLYESSGWRENPGLVEHYDDFTLLTYELTKTVTTT